MRGMFVYLGHQATQNSIPSVGGILKTKMHFSFPIETICTRRMSSIALKRYLYLAPLILI